MRLMALLMGPPRSCGDDSTGAGQRVGGEEVPPRATALGKVTNNHKALLRFSPSLHSWKCSVLCLKLQCRSRQLSLSF